MKELPVLYIVIPCYNEQQVLPVTAPMFFAKLRGLMADGLIAPQSRAVFVNDGSKDDTWAIIQDLAAKEELAEGVCLSRNRGHQNATFESMLIFFHPMFTEPTRLLF